MKNDSASFPRGFRTFVTLWGGQSLSVLGTRITGFALGVWIFQTTGSVAQFGFLLAWAVLPGLVLAPFLGTLADRWNRRSAMILGDAVAAIRVVVLLALLAGNQLEVWHVWVSAMVRSICEAVQLPAYLASVPLLVNRDSLGRVNGMMQLSTASAQVVAPAVAGLLMPVIGIEGLLLVDLLTFFLALGSLLVIRIHESFRSTPGDDPNESMLHRVGVGWRYIRARSGLVALLWLAAFFNLLAGVEMVIITPLILSFSSTANLGFVMAAGSVGAVVGSMVMSVWGGSEKKIHAVLIFSAMAGVGLTVAGARPHVGLVIAGMLIAHFSVAVAGASNQTIWHATVDPAIQGRVFALRKMLSQATLPVALLTAGPITEKLFIPLLTADGLLADSLGLFLGTGEGRGMGLELVLIGMSLLTVTAMFSFHRGLRHVESDRVTLQPRPDAR